MTSLGASGGLQIRQELYKCQKHASPAVWSKQLGYCLTFMSLGDHTLRSQFACTLRIVGKVESNTRNPKIMSLELRCVRSAWPHQLVSFLFVLTDLSHPFGSFEYCEQSASISRWNRTKAFQYDE